MTEDVQVPTSMSEYNRNVPSEKPQLQVIDIIDQIANSVEIFPYETTEPIPGSPLAQGNQGGGKHSAKNTAAYEVSVGMKELQGEPEGIEERKTDIFSQETRSWEEELREGFCEQKHPVSTIDHKVAKVEERKMEEPQIEDVYSTNEVEEEEQEEAELSEPKEPMNEETQPEENETMAEGDFDGIEEIIQKESNEGKHEKRLESNSSSKDFLSANASRNSQTEKPAEQPTLVKKTDISRHSYSRYNTISYRKIRKGNTKQRIDEFESMMHS